MALGNFSGGGVGFGAAFSLEDNFSAEAARIQSSMAGLEASTEKAAAKISAGMAQIQKGAAALAGGAILAAPFAVGFSKAVEFSDIMADVQKVTGQSAEEVEELRKAIAEIDTRTSQQDLLALAEAGGRMGVAKQDLEGFVEQADQLAVALGDELQGDAGEAAQSVAKIANVFKETRDIPIADAMRKTGSAMNALSASAETGAGEIHNFASRLGLLRVCLLGCFVFCLGLGTVMSAAGVSAEKAASGIGNVLFTATKKVDAFAAQLGMSAEKTEQLINTNPTEFLLKLSESIEGVPATELGAQFEKLGLNSIEVKNAIGALGGDMDKTRALIKKANDEFAKGNSMSEEAAVKNQTLAALVDKLGKAFESLFIEIGQSGRPVMKQIVASLTSVIRLIGAFIKSPIGKFVLGLTAVLAAFLVVLGLVNLAMGAAKLAAGSLGKAFLRLGFQSIGTTFATSGLTAGFSALAASVWAALGPIVLIVGALLAVGVAIAGVMTFVDKARDKFGELRKEMQAIRDSNKEPMIQVAEMQKAIDALSPLEKMMARIGGVVEAATEIWSSFNTETGEFALPEDLAILLSQLGILDFVKSLGTWIGRVKALFQGFAEGFADVFSTSIDIAMDFFSFVGDAFGALNDALGVFGINMANGVGELETWKTVGKAIGIVIGIITVGLLAASVAALVLAFNMIIPFLPVIIVIGAILAVIWAVKWAIEQAGAIAVSVGNAFAAAWQWVKQVFMDFILPAMLLLNPFTALIMGGVWALDAMGISIGDVKQFFLDLWNTVSEFFTSLPQMALEAGTNLVKTLLAGVKEAWGDLKNFVSEGIKKIPGLSSLIGDDEEGTAGPGGIDSGGAGGAIATAESTQREIERRQGETSQAQAQRNNIEPTVVNNTNTEVVERGTQIELDGEVIYDSMNDRANLENSRS